MKDSKSLLLLITSMLLIIVSLALLWTWGYNIGNQKNKTSSVFILKDSTNSNLLSKDSLNKLYKETATNLNSLDSTVSKADSLNYNISDKLNEFYKLRDEIAALLNNPENKSGLVNAQEKISELQTKMDDLRNQNLSIVKENKRLSGILNQLSNDQKPDANITKPVIVETKDTKRTIVKSTGSSLFSVEDMSVVGISEVDNNSTETNQADAVNKFYGTFTLKNIQAQTTNGEIMIVILQPDGKVLKSSSWESGTFESADGRKIYSVKVKYECAIGESKKINFSVNAEQFPKGNYTIQLFQNGLVIAKMIKPLV